MHCKNGRSRSIRRHHKRLRTILENAAVPAFYPIRALVGRALPSIASLSSSPQIAESGRTSGPDVYLSS
jgi:hypothetical protein